MRAYLLARAREASTWRGLIFLVTSAGIALNPLQIEAIVALGLAAAGMVGAFLPDTKVDAA